MTYDTTRSNSNPALPADADNSNLSNRSGTAREAVADTLSRGVDHVTGRDETVVMSNDMYANSSTASAAGMGTGMSGGGARYYNPVEGRVHLSGLFSDRIGAQEAVDALERMGVPRADISVIARNESETAAVAEATGTTAGSHAGQGAGAGSLVGGTVGAILGALAATATSIIIPGVGVLIAGPIAGALAGAGAGGLTGGLLGALVGAGIPEETARTYQTGLQSGGVVVVADVLEHLQDDARMILGHAVH